jgi:hypothetical protein
MTLPYTIPGNDQVQRSVHRIGGSEGGPVIVRGDGEIQSENFVTGVSGWRFDAQGNLEANDGTFRGAIEASSIDIGDDDTTSFHVDVDGNLWLGHADYASAPFTVSNDGSLAATDATLAGSLVTGTTGARVEVGASDNAFIDLYSGDAAEVDNGYINVGVDNTGIGFGYINLVAPTFDGVDRAYIDIRHYTNDNRQIHLYADTITATAPTLFYVSALDFSVNATDDINLTAADTIRIDTSDQMDLVATTGITVTSPLFQISGELAFESIVIDRSGGLGAFTYVAGTWYDIVPSGAWTPDGADTGHAYLAVVTIRDSATSHQLSTGVGLIAPTYWVSNAAGRGVVSIPMDRHNAAAALTIDISGKVTGAGNRILQFRPSVNFTVAAGGIVRVDMSRLM